MNIATYGPTFGGRHDIYVSNGLNPGYTNNYSYIHGNTQPFTKSIIGETHNDDFWVLELETYTFAPAAAVPEPATFAIWGVGALGCAAVAYRRKRKQAA